ncbi:MAG: hypothetical protein JW820_03510 [Spirochaetales bacterium]|nr:hypothetical protein [Spirochaetales bacterium]
MNNRTLVVNKSIRGALGLAAAGALVLLASCASLSGSRSKATADEEAIAQGTAAWNQKGPATAGPYWQEIEEETLRATYTGYLQSFETGSGYLAEAGSAATGGGSNEARALASYQKGHELLAALPPELKLPPETRESGLEIAEGRMRFLVASDKYSQARELGEAAVGTFGESQAVEAMNAEMDVVTASRKREADADAARTRARQETEFDRKVVALEAAAGVYARAGSRLAEDAAKARVSESRNVAREASRLRRKRQDLAVERERLLRERAYVYRDRIGEEFARVPDNVGDMSLEEILAHQQSVKAGVEAAYDELQQFAARYPEAADPEFRTEVEQQKKVLDEKIEQVNAEIRVAEESARRAREIASRGKVVMPVMIGLFNPQPGSDAEARKSRPAVLQSRNAEGNEYWWGMVSIPRGTMNDLVITVSDSREVRVFGENTKSGSLIERRNLKDLVNRGYRIGNSWPVLNAGAQLPTDKYFVEIKAGKTPAYEGEIVVYDSFVVRMR